MTQSTLTSKTYSTKSSAVRAMWSYVRQLQRDGVHTGALSDGDHVQWVGNDGRTHHASVDHDNNYYVADRTYTVSIS